MSKDPLMIFHFYLSVYLMYILVRAGTVLLYSIHDDKMLYRCFSVI
jgi:hypothetical protein